MKRKRGFTLIELLAVLVVLAIIALIAIPIVINIISDARANSNRRSIDSYGKAVDYAISRYMTDDYSNSDYSVIDKSKLKIDYSGKKVQCDVFDIGNDGELTLSKCYVGNYSSSEIDNLRKKGKWIKDEDGNPYTYKTDLHLTSTTGFRGINSNVQEGDTYSLPGTNDEFYVISSTDSYVTLLKAEPLTVDEVNRYGGGRVNRYTTDVKGTAYNHNGYGLVAYYSDMYCGFVGGSRRMNGCKSDYGQSDIRVIVDNWANDRFGDGNLTNDSLGYKARLLTKNEYNNLSSYNWRYNNRYYYWTMTSANSSTSVYRVNNSNNSVSNYDVYTFGAIRPVVNLAK